MLPAAAPVVVRHLRQVADALAVPGVRAGGLRDLFHLGWCQVTTVADLIANDSCTAACIAATTTARRCRCPCTGRHHGLLADAPIDALLTARTAGLAHLTDEELLNR